MTDSLPSSDAAAPIASGCLGRTCLKWGADGELAPVDLLLVLERLAQVDPEVMALREHSLTPQPCPSLN
jgi:hypothetical protein